MTTISLSLEPELRDLAAERLVEICGARNAHRSFSGYVAALIRRDLGEKLIPRGSILHRNRWDAPQPSAAPL